MTPADYEGDLNEDGEDMNDDTSVNDASVEIHDYNEANFTKFVQTLENNYIFDLGFKTLKQDSQTEKLCSCPCSKYMKAWRERNGMDYMS